MQISGGVTQLDAAEMDLPATGHSERAGQKPRAGYLQSNWIRSVFLAVIGFAVRMPALQGQLVWDDQYLAHDNPFIKSPLLILEAFRHYLFLDSFSAHYRPVQNISFILDYLLWNTDPYGFHLTNVFLHVTSGILLYFLLRKLLVPLWKAGAQSESRASLAAFLVALLWVVHPVHSAAVDYISGRADSLAFLFACGGWLVVFRAREIRSRLFRGMSYASAAGCGLLALCSREIACVWLALFLLHTLFFEKRLSRRAKLISLGCCLIVLGIYAGLRQLPEQRPNSNPTYDWSRPTRAVLMLRALGDYGRLMVFPANLHMERTVVHLENYRSKEAWRRSVVSEYLSILGAVVVAAFLYGACRTGRAQAMRIFGAGWFLLGYLPISNLIDLNGTAAEHWLYLPSVGFLIFLSGCAVELPLRYHKITLAFALVALLGFSARSIIRSSDWVTAETFYRRTLAAGGSSTRIAINLGLMYGRRGDYAKAEQLFRRVLEFTPNYPIARNNLADVLLREGKKAEAEALFTMLAKDTAAAAKEYPRTWIGIYNLAGMRHNAHDDPAAIALLDKARADYPYTWEIISLEAEILRERKGPEAALHLVENFAQQNWWHYSAALALGRLYAEKGDVVRASDALHHASRLDVHDVEALNLIAMISVRQNRLEDARRAQVRAVARQPDRPRQYVMLSNILEKMGRAAEARAALAQVTRLQTLAQTQPLAN